MDFPPPPPVGTNLFLSKCPPFFRIHIPPWRSAHRGSINQSCLCSDPPAQMAFLSFCYHCLQSFRQKKVLGHPPSLYLGDIGGVSFSWKRNLVRSQREGCVCWAPSCSSYGFFMVCGGIYVTPLRLWPFKAPPH